MPAVQGELVEIELAAAAGEPSDAELAALEDIESAGWFACDGPAPVRVTFLDLVRAVSEVSTTESEVVATVAYMLSSGSIELIGEACH